MPRSPHYHILGCSLVYLSLLLIRRVAGMHSICDKDSGSNPISGILGKRLMDRGLNPNTVQLTEQMLNIYLKAHSSLLKNATIGKESGGGTLI